MSPLARSAIEILLVLPLGCTLTELDDLQGGQGGASAASATSAKSSGSGGGVASGYAAVVLADMPIAYWRLGEQNGVEARDEIDSAHHGQYLGNVTLGAPGAIEGDTAAGFDGLTAYVSVPNFPGFEGTLPFSVEAWVEPNLLTATRAIIGHARYDGVTGAVDGYRAYYTQGTLYCDRASYEGMDGLQAADALRLGVYTHFVLVYDGSTLTLFLNGESVTSTASTTPLGGYGAFGFGADLEFVDSSVVSYFSGSIDEVAVYGYALSPTQIAAHYAGGR